MACNGLTRFLAVEVTGVIILRTILVPGGNVARREIRDCFAFDSQTLHHIKTYCISRVAKPALRVAPVSVFLYGSADGAAIGLRNRFCCRFESYLTRQVKGIDDRFESHLA